MVPTHDEREHLPDCLAALADAAARAPLPVHVTVVADSCRDDTAAVAEAAGATVVTIAARNVGAARAAGFARVARPGRWLATTDADTRVPRTWFTDQLAQRADVVAGEVDVLDWTSWPTWLPHLHRARYSRERGHVHGANLAFTAEAYLAVGGFPALPVHEDVRLVEHLRAAGFRVVHPDTAPVVTSARRTSRCTGGFATHLTDLAEAHGAVLRARRPSRAARP